MSKGIARERAVRKVMEEDGWWVARCAGSLGDADLVGLKEGWRPRMIEVKATARGPFHAFGPADREALIDAAQRAGATPWLVWWPPGKKIQWIPRQDWPGAVA